MFNSICTGIRRKLIWIMHYYSKCWKIQVLSLHNICQLTLLFIPEPMSSLLKCVEYDYSNFCLMEAILLTALTFFINLKLFWHFRDTNDPKRKKND